ncbi:hypothetical protein [Rhodohalobacter halophilus]|uniref:hypothetical protein n=1 Tax=Rhodohalobacter halophilus TaxID=1812810 RepID=UPI00114CAC66|nr:hypothetical protein [Rhodohalobacter halophilus]
MKKVLFILLPVLFLASCTTTRWVVTEQHAVDERAEPRIVLKQTTFVFEEEPTVDNPIATFSLYNIEDREYPERIRVERTVQRYKPKWGFVLLGLAGATVAGLAANSGILLSNPSTAQQLGLNLTAGLMGVLSFTNLQPAGEPIYTGETKLMRQSGTEVFRDSVRYQPEEELVADLKISLRDSLLFSQDDVPLDDGLLELNLGSFSDDLTGQLDENSVIEIELGFEGQTSRFAVPVNRFLAPYLNVEVLVASLRSNPEQDDVNIVTEVGQGSFLEIVENEHERFFKVRYEENEYYIDRDAGVIEWLSTAESGPALVFEFAELPFGEIDVERAMPVLKPNNPSDRSLVITNGINNDLLPRQYLERDHQLFEAYMKNTLRLQDNQISRISGADPIGGLRNADRMNGEGSLYIYLSGVATVKSVNGRSEIFLTHRENEISLSTLFERITRINPGALFLFVDLDYINGDQQDGESFLRSGESGLLQRTANTIVRELPNSAILFSNKPGQRSNIYTGIIDGNRRHTIFNYYWAEAIQQRKTRMSDLVNHLDRNVDYTSRRLHDSPQEIQAFGNLTLNLAR